MRYSIKFSFSGAGFCGWQKQPSAPSVQDSLEDALGKLLGCDIPVTGAGRTDAGVNSIGYTACFDGPEGLCAEQFRYKLNAILPEEIAVLEVKEEKADFHARFDAVRREYTYFLHRGKDPFAASWSLLYDYPELDVAAMNRAAALLVGRHDFSCFEKVGADNKTSVCTVYEAAWHPYIPTHVSLMGPVIPSTNGLTASAYAGQADSAQDSPYLYFRISADRFLRNMVRATVGTLLEVGRGRRSIDNFAGLVLPADTPSAKRSAEELPAQPSRRCLAGQSVPGHALFLSKVRY